VRAQTRMLLEQWSRERDEGQKPAGRAGGKAKGR
jgi:hypothetical protein